MRCCRVLARVGQDERKGRSGCMGFARMALSSLSSSIVSRDSAVRNVAVYPFSKHFAMKLDIFCKVLRSLPYTEIPYLILDRMRAS